MRDTPRKWHIPRRGAGRQAPRKRNTAHRASGAVKGAAWGRDTRSHKAVEAAGDIGAHRVSGATQDVEQNIAP